MVGIILTYTKITSRIVKFFILEYCGGMVGFIPLEALIILKRKKEEKDDSNAI